MLSKLRAKFDLDPKEILSLRQLERYLALRSSWSKISAPSAVSKP